MIPFGRGRPNREGQQMHWGGNSIQLSITISITIYTRLLSVISSQLIG
jgi:hypothetical protein